MYKVVIVEDDYMIAMLNRSYVEKDGRFLVTGEFPSGKPALQYLRENEVDLLILDVYMPVMTGVELLRQLRAEGHGIDAIVVTAAHEKETLRELLQLGAIDYLVKPFGAARFRQALDRFCAKRELLKGQSEVSQREIDALLQVKEEQNVIPKGLQEKTLETIRAQLHNREGRTCELIAEKTGLSVVTVRRYLAFLVECSRAYSRIRYNTGGRPCSIYWGGQDEPEDGPENNLEWETK